MSRAIGVPFTRNGRERMLGLLVSNCLGPAIVAGILLVSSHCSKHAS
jgi:hypothetical protein